MSGQFPGLEVILWTVMTNTENYKYIDAFTAGELHATDRDRFTKAMNVIYGPKGKRGPSFARRGPSKINDFEVVAKMREKVNAGKRPYTAARELVHEAGGVGSDDSKIKRMVKKYKEDKAPEISEEMLAQYEMDGRNIEELEKVILRALKDSGWPDPVSPPTELIG